MKTTYAIDLTERAKKLFVQWYESNSRFTLADPEALIAEIRNHPRFGDDGFTFEITRFESKTATTKTFGFETQDYVYSEKV